MNGTGGDRASIWRFIDDGDLPGAFNMAVDMAMTMAAARGEAPATLRLYGWRAPTISLGCHQSEEDIDPERCRRDGVEAVFRPTGGRAVLHYNEVTYAVVLPPSSPFYAADIMSVYALVSRCLVNALQRVGAPVDFERGKKPTADTGRDLAALCYASASQYEIVVQGRKLVGSAQRRINNGALQHGSILIGNEHLDIVEYLSGLTDHQRKRLRQAMERRTITLNRACPHPPQRHEVRRAVKEAFTEVLGIRFVEEPLSANERREAENLAKRFSILENPAS